MAFPLILCRNGGNSINVDFLIHEQTCIIEDLAYSREFPFVNKVRKTRKKYDY